ncbi:MAG: GCN5-related N-acetyltransferase [Verrucomicrobiales bacterium]|nr:GCN5-related N-acetyltransferase [Verrucomicrobiales bacterium]
MKLKNGIEIRQGEAKDGPALIRLILELADYEKLQGPDEEAQRRLLDHAFGEKPRVEVLLAWKEGDSEPVGYAMIFETYSSFLAKPTLYLEDIFIKPNFRGLGAGRGLFEHCLELAKTRDCGRVEWTCLDWNVPAQEFYERKGAKRMKEWYLYRKVL